MKFFDFSKITAYLNKLSKRERTIFYVTASFIGILVFDQAVIRPLIGNFYTLSQQIQTLENNIKKSVRLLAQKDRMLKEAEEYAVYDIELKSAEEDTVAILKHIEELAHQASVNLLYAKPSGTASKEKANQYFVTLECEGQMEQIIGFFYEIEKSIMLLRIEKYALSPAAKGSTVIKGAATISRAILP